MRASSGGLRIVNTDPRKITNVTVGMRASSGDLRAFKTNLREDHNMSEEELVQENLYQSTLALVSSLAVTLLRSQSEGR